MQAEEQPDGQGKKYKTRYTRVGCIKSVKILRTDTTHDLSQKAREDERKEDGCKGKQRLYTVEKARACGLDPDRDPLTSRWLGDGEKSMIPWATHSPWCLANSEAGMLVSCGTAGMCARRGGRRNGGAGYVG